MPFITTVSSARKNTMYKGMHQNLVVQHLVKGFFYTKKNSLLTLAQSQCK